MIEFSWYIVLPCILIFPLVTTYSIVYSLEFRMEFYFFEAITYCRFQSVSNSPEKKIKKIRKSVAYFKPTLFRGQLYTRILQLYQVADWDKMARGWGAITRYNVIYFCSWTYHLFFIFSARDPGSDRTSAPRTSPPLAVFSGWSLKTTDPHQPRAGSNVSPMDLVFIKLVLFIFKTAVTYAYLLENFKHFETS